MGEILQLDDFRTEKYAEGEAFCFRCDHIWVACAPIGTEDLECPSCKTMKGRFKYEIAPSDYTWRCNCGNFYFLISPSGAMCPNCGVEQEF